MLLLFLVGCDCGPLMDSQMTLVVLLLLVSIFLVRNVATNTANKGHVANPAMVWSIVRGVFLIKVEVHYNILLKISSIINY